jgi:hypothetical protein
MQYTKKEREQYNHSRALTCADLGIREHQYNWFRRVGDELHSMYEENCNGAFESCEEYEALTAPLEKKATEKAQSLGLYIYFQTDPRGATIYLDKEPIAENAYNRSHCIF